MHEDKQDTIARIVRKVADRKLGMFAAFKDVDRDDLVQEATVAVMLALGSYDKSKGAVSTFTYLVASRTIIDLHRARTRTGERETKVVEMKPTSVDPVEIAEPAGVEERWSLPLKEFAAETYRRNIFIVPKRRPGRGPQTYSPIVAATLIDLKARTKSSYRGLEMMLTERSELRESLRLKTVPSFMTLQRLCNKCPGSSANNRTQRRKSVGTGNRALNEGCLMAKNKEWVNETRAAELFNCSQATLRTRRDEGKLPAGVIRINPITQFTEYSTSAIRQIMEGAVVTK